MLERRVRITSVARNPSGRTILRIALSSSVRSNHWLACVCAALVGRDITFGNVTLIEYWD